MFIKATMIPKITKKTRIPTFQLSASFVIMPPSSWKSRVLNISSKLPLAYSKAPIAIPTNREEYTSLVINAKPIAITGGSREKIVE